MSDLIDCAGEYWKASRAYEAGALVLLTVPIRERPAWAGRVLAICAAELPSAAGQDLISEVIRVAGDPARLRDGRELAAMFAQRKVDAPAVEIALLDVAECVLTLSGHGADTATPFADDAGCVLLDRLHTFNRLLGKPRFEKAFWWEFAHDTFREGVGRLSLQPRDGTNLQPPRPGSLLESARQFWNEGEAYSAGACLLLRVPEPVQPIWAGRVLACCAATCSFADHPLIREAIEMAGDTDRWKNGHKLANRLVGPAYALEHRISCCVTAHLPRNSEDEVLCDLLYAAVMVMRVAYNGTRPSDPFDDDCGCDFVSCVHGFVKREGSAEAESAVWSLLTSPQG